MADQLNLHVRTIQYAEKKLREEGKIDDRKRKREKPNTDGWKEIEYDGNLSEDQLNELRDHGETKKGKKRNSNAIDTSFKRAVFVKIAAISGRDCDRLEEIFGINKRRISNLKLDHKKDINDIRMEIIWDLFDKDKNISHEELAQRMNMPVEKIDKMIENAPEIPVTNN